MSLTEILASHQQRLTTPRKAVFTALEQSSTPLSIQQLIARCPTINRTSIYRSLSLFTRLGIVSVVHVGWKQRYELAEPFAPHHHHLQCTQCHRIIDIETPELEQLITAISRRYHFQPTDHHFEIHGRCQACQRKTNTN
ncbi:MAG: Fur family transcriptional regulator [Candidatus Saccharibacteria bacterium]|nr:Fur family transcriptional regulator [Candidatus Saccharibacteria bacterium]